LGLSWYNFTPLALEYSQETESDAFLKVEKEAQTLNTGMTGLGVFPLI